MFQNRVAKGENQPPKQSEAMNNHDQVWLLLHLIETSNQTSQEGRADTQLEIVVSSRYDYCIYTSNLEASKFIKQTLNGIQHHVSSDTIIRGFNTHSHI